MFFLEFHSTYLLFLSAVKHLSTQATNDKETEVMSRVDEGRREGGGIEKFQEK